MGEGMKVVSIARMKKLIPVGVLLATLIACSSVAPTATPTPTVSVEVVDTPNPTATAESKETPEATRTELPEVSASATPDAEPTPRPTASPSPAPTSAGESVANADVLFVRAVQGSDGRWTFHVTVEHPDTGWEDYADGWDVLTPDGEVLRPNKEDIFTRLLLHPHENEQPFTRSQSSIVIPEGVTQVRVRAHDLMDGFGGREVVVDLTVSSGPDFEVEQ